MAEQPRKRKDRSDSVGFQTGLMQQAVAGIEPPAGMKLTKAERPYWAAITAARADWTGLDLVHAVNLAQTFAIHAEQQALLRKEGYVITSANGGSKVNPRFALVLSYSRLLLAYCSRLKIHTAATLGTSRDMAARNIAWREAQRVAADLGDDEGLIARPRPDNKPH